MSPEHPTVLIIGAGLLQVPLIEEAHRLGLLVVATDGNPQAPGLDVADAHYVVDTYDAMKTSALAEGLKGAGWNVRGVCTAGADVAATVAAVAQKIGVPGISPDIAQETQQKHRVRSFLRNNRTTYRHQPDWDQWYPFQDSAQDLVTCIETIGYPCVLKPSTQRASRGVTLLHDRTDFASAVMRIVPYYDHKVPVLIEQRLFGTEYSVECLLDGMGNAICWNESQRYFDYADGIPIELGHVNPPACDNTTLQAMHQVVLATARAMGITWGPWKNDLLVDNTGHVWVLECCARLSGGYDCQRTQPMARGWSIMRPLLQLACGMPIHPEDITPTQHMYAACTAITLPQGTVTQLENHTSSAVTWHINLGDHIGLLEHNAQRAGFAFVGGRSALGYAWADARTLAQQAAQWVTIEGGNHAL